jgi:hypothetical protein
VELVLGAARPLLAEGGEVGVQLGDVLRDGAGQRLRRGFGGDAAGEERGVDEVEGLLLGAARPRG